MGVCEALCDIACKKCSLHKLNLIGFDDLPLLFLCGFTEKVKN